MSRKNLSSQEPRLERSSPCYNSTAGTSASGTSGSRCFSLILLHERIRSRIRLCHFSTLIDIVAETAIVSFNTARWLHIANNLQEFFVHAVLFPDS